MPDRRAARRRRCQERAPPNGIIFALNKTCAVFAGFAIFAVFAVFASPAQSPERARTEALARRATDRLQALQREADRLAAEERTVLGDLRKLEIERQLKSEQVRQLDGDIASIQTELAGTTENIASLQQSELAARPELRARLVSIYKLGRARYLRLLLGTADARQLGHAARTIAALAAMDRERLASHQRTLDEITSGRRTLDTRSRQFAALRADAEQARVAAIRAADARNALVRDIDRRRDVNAQLAGELQGAQQKLQRVLRDVAAGAGAPAAMLPIGPFRGDLDWPVAGAVRTRFAPAERTPSNGIEIGAAEGSDAAAVHDGTVAFAGPFSGFGNLVILDHGAQTFSLYGDLLDTAVKKGDRVDRGRRVGTVGPTASGAAGLYFELRVDGHPVDPLQWLKQKH